MVTIVSGIRWVSWIHSCMSYAIILEVAGSNAHIIVFCRSAMFTLRLLAPLHSLAQNIPLRTHLCDCLSLSVQVTYSATLPTVSEAHSRLNSNQRSTFPNSTVTTLRGSAMTVTCKNILFASSIPGSRAS